MPENELPPGAAELGELIERIVKDDRFTANGGLVLAVAMDEVEPGMVRPLIVSALVTAPGDDSLTGDEYTKSVGVATGRVIGAAWGRLNDLANKIAHAGSKGDVMTHLEILSTMQRYAMSTTQKGDAWNRSVVQEINRPEDGGA